MRIEGIVSPDQLVANPIERSVSPDQLDSPTIQQRLEQLGQLKQKFLKEIKK
jgi:hypothetical protein